MADEEQPKKEEGGGAPGWVMTFADLMSLLMCFFVLLLSFSEMDVQKYKQIAGSMKSAFGVQRDIRASDIPKGTSIVAKEFSPAKPEPTVINKVQQKTTDSNKKSLQQGDSNPLSTKKDARAIAKILESEIKAGEVEVESKGDKIIVRIMEKGSFSSGGAELEDEFEPVLDKIRKAIKSVKGQIKVAGHTDDRPISTAKYRSNWELSAARAVSVAHALMKKDSLQANRFQIAGYADTRPRVPNDTDENRMKNRRVDIVILQSEPVQKKVTVIEAKDGVKKVQKNKDSSVENNQDGKLTPKEENTAKGNTPPDQQVQESTNQ